MSMNISGLGNAYSGVNTNSKQYKALKEKGWLEGVIQNEAMMSPEEKMIYEIFGGRDTIVNNLMKQFAECKWSGRNGCYWQRYIVAETHKCI